MRTRSMRIDAGLSEYLWHEFIKTTRYMANCTSMQKPNWKIFFEMLLGIAFNLSYLHKIGCKAYALDKNVPCKQKFKEQAHIDHFVGYDSTNIFRIWILSQRKIICTKDVLFDENFFYNASKSDPNLSQISLEPMTYAVPPLAPDAQIIEV